MNDRTCYRLCLWIVWLQLALLPVVVCMARLTTYSREWRWGLDSWVFIFGFLLGVLALPVGHGLDKPKLLKWWLRIDFTVSLTLMIPVLILASRFIPQTLAEHGDYCVYSVDGIVANRSAILAKKSGLFYKKVFDLFPYYWGRLKPEHYRIDQRRGYFYAVIDDSPYFAPASPLEFHSQAWVVPLDYDAYNANSEYVFQLIDSVFNAHAPWDGHDQATFILPDDFARIDYDDSSISFRHRYHATIDYSFSDSIEVHFYDPYISLTLPRDSAAWLSPVAARTFIDELGREIGYKPRYANGSATIDTEKTSNIHFYSL